MPPLLPSRARADKRPCLPRSAEHRHALRRFFDLPEEILTAPDPLADMVSVDQRDEWLSSAAFNVHLAPASRRA